MDFFDDRLRKIAEINIASQAYELVPSRSHYVRGLIRLTSRHNYDIIGTFIFYLLIFFVAGAIIYKFSDLFLVNMRDGLQLIFGATIFGALIGMLSKLIESAQKRLGTIDLFTSEILSIGRVFTSGNIIGGLLQCYDQVDRMRVQYAPNPPPLKNFSTRYDDALRKENYLSNFDRNSSDLGPFSESVVSNVTAFYTFLRASRDATGALSLWSNENYPIEMRKNDIIIICYYCLLMAIHGRQALESLIGDKSRQGYIREVFNTIELQTFTFLLITLAPGDPRMLPMKQRRRFYERIISRNYKSEAGSLLDIMKESDRRAEKS